MLRVPSGLFATVFERHKQLHPFNHYTGILSLQALARLAVANGNSALVQKAREELKPFADGTIALFGNFPVYRCGGNGTAYLFRHGYWPEAGAILENCAAEQFAAPRGEERVFCRPSPRELPERKIWIDTAFAVCPFFANCGVALGREEYVDEAVHQILAMRSLLLDEGCGLVHQGKNFNGPGVLSQDHWSRGNGWGLLALAEVLDALPIHHPRRQECAYALREWLDACLKCQNEEGLWYQEMTVDKPGITYTETSGSALILFALATAIRLGVSPNAESALKSGLAGIREYITGDGAIFHTCASCCCPGDGSVSAFLQRPPIKDDSHAFGAVLMALAGISQLTLSQHSAIPT